MALGEPIPASRAPLSPLQLDLELVLLLAELELHLPLDLVRDRDLELHLAPIELDLLAAAGKQVGDPTQPGGGLIAGEGLALLHLEGVHRHSPLSIDQARPSSPRRSRSRAARASSRSGPAARRW